MRCPHCDTIFEAYHAGSVRANRCPQCHALLFKNNDVHFLSYDEAAQIADDNISVILNKRLYLCPNCSSVMEKNELGYHCPHCGSQLTSSGLLMSDKKKRIEELQEERPSFTFSQLRGTVIIASVAMLFFVNYIILSRLSTRSTVNTEASGIVESLHVQHKNGGDILVLFTTHDAYRSKLLVEQQKQQTYFTISNTPQLAHMVNIPYRLRDARMTIILIDQEGMEARSDVMSLRELLSAESQ